MITVWMTLTSLHAISGPTRLLHFLANNRVDQRFLFRPMKLEEKTYKRMVILKMLKTAGPLRFFDPYMDWSSLKRNKKSNM